MAEASRKTTPSAHVVQVVDGNALAGVLQTFGQADPTSLRVECASCGAVAPLAGWVVEVDRSSFIVRCRSCTRTLWTILRDGDALELRIAGGPVVRTAG